jgi:hypothetical protein
MTYPASDQPLRVITGSLVTEEAAHPFILYFTDGSLLLDEYEPQAALPNLSEAERTRLENLLRGRLDFPIQEIRFGEYRCTVCGEWVPALRSQWSLSICLSCSLDRDSELWELYS